MSNVANQHGIDLEQQSRTLKKRKRKKPKLRNEQPSTLESLEESTFHASSSKTLELEKDKKELSLRLEGNEKPPDVVDTKQGIIYIQKRTVDLERTEDCKTNELEQLNEQCIELETIKKELWEVKNKVTLLEKENFEQGKDLAKYKKIIEQKSVEQNDAISKIEPKGDEICDFIKELEKRVQDLEKQNQDDSFSTFQKDLYDGTLVEKKVKQNLETRGLNESDIGIKAKGGLEIKLEQILIENVALQAANESLQVEKVQRKVEVATLESQLTSLNRQHAKLQLANSQLAAENDSLVRLVEAKKKDFEFMHYEQITLLHHHEKLSSERDSLEHEKEILEERALAVEKKLNDCNIDLSCMKDRITNQEAEHSKLKVNFRCLSTDSERLRKENKIQGEKYSACLAENIRLTHQNTELSNELSNKMNQIKNLEIEYAKINQICETTVELASENGEQFIRKHDTKASKIPQLGFSARLMYENMELVIHSRGCLMISDDCFVAKVLFVKPNQLLHSRDFEHEAKTLLEQLRIDQVLLDEVTSDRNKHRELLLLKLEQISYDEGQVNDRIQLLKLIGRFREHGRLAYADLCQELTNHRFQYEDLQEHVRILPEIECKASRRDRLFNQIKYRPKDLSPNLMERLKKIERQIVEHQMNLLRMEAPAYLHGLLNKIDQEHLMLISSKDVKLFTDMSSVLKADVFGKPLQDLAKRWINQVTSINVGNLQEPLKLTSDIFFYLCKSLEEVIVEITERTAHRAPDLLKSSHLGWYPIDRIIWKSENALTECFQREYYFIFRLLKHFEATADFGRQPFRYTTQLFNNSQSTSQKLVGGIKKLISHATSVFKSTKGDLNPFGVPDDFYVWYCLLDDVLFHIVPNDCQTDMFNNVFESYVQMIREPNYDQMETLRVVTHNLLRYIAQFYSYGGRTSPNSALDTTILRKQLNIFSFKNNPNFDASKTFRDHLDVFNQFWKIRNDIIDPFSSKINHPKMVLLQQRLMDIMSIVLDKDVAVDTRVAFLRTYYDFLADLNDVSFDWYIKPISENNTELLLSLGQIELVDNKWKDTNNRTYRVLDAKFFCISIQTLNTAAPVHYIIEIIESFLDNIGSQLQHSNWASDRNRWTTDQVVSTNELIGAIRNSLLYLQEQVDYVSFDLFYNERVQPFNSVVESATSRQDFSNRINLIKESFWYIRKQNEISFEDALRMYGEYNSSHNLQLLRKSYEKYCEDFEEFMQMSNNEDYSKRAVFIAEKVKKLLPNSIHFKTWDDRFKQNQIPKILAGLGAVWSILVSKDVAKVGKYLNPHCIQILCILRLLSVDNSEKGVDKHLAQVLTGQGKSLVLGLLAALFTLTGHKVRITCYSEYLANRDEQDFLSFYNMFNIAENVTYGTFDELANEIVEPTVNGQKIKLRDLTGDLLLNDKKVVAHRLIEPDSSNDVLLMDEVDVFFTKEFYGDTYNPCNTLLIPGLDCIQEQIWKFVVAGETDVETSIKNFIKDGEFNHQKQFLEFLERPNFYTICEYGEKFNTYTNKIFFDKHLAYMIRNAKVANSQPSNWVKFKLNSEGLITSNDKGVYGFTLYGYQNIFNYFRLKKENFVTQVGWRKNYGYLNINCGSLAYAMLPKNYPLIVGVSGTVTSLNQYEKNTIEELYNIRKTSVMPTFFGCSNLKFDEISNFHHHATKFSWRTNIFRQANQMIAANRAVIIFFETDAELNAFEAEYTGQFDRLNVLTENTDDKESFIGEAGVAKTITLATRGMGRGVDYKSSVTVEKNGGVHIIQTFFSMDVKEETQIKGRTARKDNKGSYELIVYDEDLKSQGLASDLSSMTYTKLHAARNQKSLDENAKLSDKIQKSMDAHQNTMDYMRTFFKK